MQLCIPLPQTIAVENAHKTVSPFVLDSLGTIQLDSSLNGKVPMPSGETSSHDILEEIATFLLGVGNVSLCQCVCVSGWWGRGGGHLNPPVEGIREDMSNQVSTGFRKQGVTLV